MSRLEKILPWAVVVLMAAWVTSKVLPPRTAANAVDYYKLGSIPVRDGGRVMPLDTLARSSLQAISGLTEVKDEKGNVVASAMEWLAQVFDVPPGDLGAAGKYKIFRIEHDQVLAKLELPRRPGFFRYSYAELQANFDKLDEASQSIERKKDAGGALDLFDAKIVEIRKKLNQFHRLNRTGGREPTDQIQAVPPSAPGEDWLALTAIDRANTRAVSEADFEAMQNRASTRLQAEVRAQFGDVKEIPPAIKERLMERLEMYQRQELQELLRTRRGAASPAAGAFTRLITTARTGKGELFEDAYADYTENYLKNAPASEVSNAKLETWALGHAAPFYWLANLYLVQIVLALLARMLWTQPLNRSAFYLGVFAFAIHTLALIVRMYVHGRPPVTNLYSSAVFIGWGAVGLTLLLEYWHRDGIGNLVAGTVGAATMEVAHFLSLSGDTLGMLVAVLDTNFWLATHVTTVTLGYTATLVAGFIGMIYIVLGIVAPSSRKDADKALGAKMYGVICFATLLSFVGTVLGGIWADYSWGRFWGWDPKENGAVMIVVWNALILHARWGGMVKTRGMANLALVGNMVTAWSWFGTNQLGIGLHAYGFNNELAMYCRWFWYSQLGMIAIGLVPIRFWSSIGAGARKFFTQEQVSARTK